MADIDIKPGASSGGMRDPRFEIENDKVRFTLNRIAKRIGSSLDSGWGFLLMLFEYGTPGNAGSMFYISSAERRDVMRMAQEWIDRQKADATLRASELNPDDPTTRAVHDHWHKLVALLLLRMAKGGDPMQYKATFTGADVAEFAALGRVAVGVRDDADGMTLYLQHEDDALAQIKSGEAKLDPPLTAEEIRNVKGS